MLDDKHALFLGGERAKRSHRARHWLAGAALAALAFKFAPFPRRPPNAPEILAQCAALHIPAGPHPDFFSRSVSDRFVQGTKPTLIRNATVWTGHESGNEVVYGDVLLDGGIIRAVGSVSSAALQGQDINEVHAHGQWLTPGLFDLHSHVGVFSTPGSIGASGDFMSSDGPVVPWMRSIDGLNTHDASYELAVAGGLTGGLILPGSSNAIGGQAFAIKFRETAERTPSSKLIDSPLGQVIDRQHPPRWRHMKHACGENQLRYGSRFDSAWAFRQGYEEARKIRDAQDAYCAKATAGKWDEIEKTEFPYSLKWEALVDVLRGRVKVNTHCYEAVDFDQIVRLTNEFKFPIAAFHHASEAYLVTDLLKKTWGGTPAVAIFATNGRYKREAFRASEFAPKILAENGIPVVMKTDHPVIHARDILFEAQKAHYYGLATNLALASVISTPVIAAGLDHRLGYIKEGYDADVVLWDAHPLQVGATPTQVFIDGIPQFSDPHVSTGGPSKAQHAPRTPRWDREASEALKHQGLAPLEPRRRARSVAFLNVGSATHGQTVLVRDGFVVESDAAEAEETIDLQGGHIVPGFISFGSPLGMEEISTESSTSDGPIVDPLMASVPAILGDSGAAIRAVDGLRFETRHALLAYRTGVTAAVAVPIGTGVFRGVSTAFRLGEAHALAPGAVLKEAAALHLMITVPSGSFIQASHGLSLPSISTQIAVLRRLLTDNVQGETGRLFARAAKGDIPLVITVTGADAMAALLRLKSELETQDHSVHLRMVFNNANEAHLLAKEIAHAGVGVILTPVRPFPTTWDERRIVPGPPLTKDTTLTILLRHNITVGIGIREAWEAMHTRFMLKWAMEESSGFLDESSALALATTNIAKLLGLDEGATDFVAYSGGSWHEQESKVVAVLSPARNVVDIFS